MWYAARIYLKYAFHMWCSTLWLLAAGGAGPFHWFKPALCFFTHTITTPKQYQRTISKWIQTDFTMTLHFHLILKAAIETVSFVIIDHWHLLDTNNATLPWSYSEITISINKYFTCIYYWYTALAPYLMAWVVVYSCRCFWFIWSLFWYFSLIFLHPTNTVDLN